MSEFSKDAKAIQMAAIRQKHTLPELRVRQVLHRKGRRFRLHRRDLPGTPDIVLPRFKLAIFVHGCFWHQHDNCSKATLPKKNREFWQEKFDQNRQRDKAVHTALETKGWKVEVIWECETKSEQSLEATVDRIIKKHL